MPQPTQNLGSKSFKITASQRLLTNARAMSLNLIMDTMAWIPKQMIIVENSPKITTKAFKVK